MPSAEDAAREAQEAEDMRRRNRNRKGRRSTILTSPTYGDTTATTDKPTLLGGYKGGPVKELLRDQNLKPAPAPAPAPIMKFQKDQQKLKYHNT